MQPKHVLPTSRGCAPLIMRGPKIPLVEILIRPVAQRLLVQLYPQPWLGRQLDEFVLHNGERVLNHFLVVGHIHGKELVD